MSATVRLVFALVALAAVRAHAYCTGFEKPVFTLGVLGPFSLQQFWIILFDILNAKMDFESDTPLLSSDLAGRTINASCFDIKLVAIDEAGNQDKARNGAMQLCLGDTCSIDDDASSSLPDDFSADAVIGLVAGQVPSNCADSAEISTAFRVPQVAWGCAMELAPPREFFLRAHQMDFPEAFAALWHDLGWTRVTVVWESAETFSYYNYVELVEQMSAVGVTIHSAELVSLPDNTPDYEAWRTVLHDAKAYRDTLWVVLTGPSTSKVLFPWLVEQGDLMEPWMQHVSPGSTKSSIIGVLNKAIGAGDTATLELFADALIVRPRSHHTVADGWLAAPFFERMATRTLDDFRNKPSAFGLGFDPVEQFGNDTVQAMLDDPEALFKTNHNWPFAYDALYTFLFAIDELLRAGVAPEDVRGAELLAAVQRQSFEGTSKQVRFVDGGKRPGDWAIDRLSVDLDELGFGFGMAAAYGHGALTWSDAALRASLLSYADRLPRCEDGFVRDLATATCVACGAGSYANEALWTSLEDPDREVCQTCSSGRVAKKAGSPSCSSCEIRHEAAEDSMSCVACQDGYVSDGEGGACTLLAADHRSLWIALIVTGVVLSLTCVGGLMHSARKAYLKYNRAREQHNQHQREKIAQARTTTSKLSHPMVVINVDQWLKLGKFVCFEETRRAGITVTFDTLEDVEAFTDQGHQIIFVSHQWTGWADPDPSNKQYQAVNEGIRSLLERNGWTPDKAYIWADFSSIPQKHRGLQALAIDSLPAYASSSVALLIVAPAVEHTDTGRMCDKESYQKRAWCRAEQLSFLLGATNKDQMFMAEGGALKPLTVEWLVKSARVFEGNLTCCYRNHEGASHCDKELLVVPMLGLWMASRDEVCRPVGGGGSAIGETATQMMRQIAPQDIFPATFQFKTAKGEETRELFGDLLARLGEAPMHVQPAKQNAPGGPSTAHV